MSSIQLQTNPTHTNQKYVLQIYIAFTMCVAYDIYDLVPYTSTLKTDIALLFASVAIKPLRYPIS